jgi:peptide/nickel transport system ATP-binding protein/oligopeptide transport system ATP-binding protein
MYLGKIVETASKTSLFERPLHPYTQALLASVPKPDPQKRHSLAVLSGDVPSPINVPSGCRFHPRCPQVKEECSRLAPSYIEVEHEHWVACHLYGAVENEAPP